MKTTRPNLTTEYELFEDLGFSAGITLRGQWGIENSVRDHIRSEVIPAGFKAVFPTQVHGAEIEHIDSNYSGAQIQADGLISNSRNICLTVTTADCLPLLLTNSKTGFFGAVHVGWRSYLSGIIENVFNKFQISGTNADEIYCHLGPAIGQCCFEVGSEVSILFEPDFILERNGRKFADLRSGILKKLANLGVKESYVSNLDDCTSCVNERYYSFRRDKDTPIQMISYIYHNGQNGGGSF